MLCCRPAWISMTVELVLLNVPKLLSTILPPFNWSITSMQSTHMEHFVLKNAHVSNRIRRAKLIRSSFKNTEISCKFIIIWNVTILWMTWVMGTIAMISQTRKLKFKKLKWLIQSLSKGLICVKLEYSVTDFQTHYFHYTSLFLHVICFSEKWLVYVAASHTTNEVCFSYQ